MSYRPAEINEQQLEDFINILNTTDEDRKHIYDTARAAGIKNTPAPKGYKWGAAQRTYSCGTGIRYVPCSGHGGYLISPARQAGIPEVFQDIEMAYEEDCDFKIIWAFYPKAAYNIMARQPGMTKEENISYARRVGAEYLLRFHKDEVMSYMSGVSEAAAAA